VSVYTSAHVECDATVPSAVTDSGTAQCPAEVKGGQQPDGSWVFPRTQVAARKLARSQGWLFVRYQRVSFLSKDYCPAHEDQARAAAEEFGYKLTLPKAKQEESDD
jgi:hypothetical protein